jgi:PAS domain S-box-containing protein
LIGLVFPLVAIILVITTNNMPLEFASVDQAHQENLLLWFVDAVPVITMLAGLFYARQNQLRNVEKKEVESSYNQRSSKLTQFVDNIIRDESRAKVDLKGEDDMLAKSLVSLSEKIKQNQQAEEKRKKEEEQRRWAAEGLAEFGEILRQDNDNLEKLSFNLLKNLIKYTGANQGGFFLINDDVEEDKYIEQLAAYAYDRKKYTEKRLDMDQGLIGACIFEKEKIYLKEVPEDYVFITSGLGKSTPDALLIVPLKVNERVLGAIEMATFGEFEGHVLEFIDKVAESIATTVSNIKINLKTSKLLEESISKSEQLSSQEEEMRQNMEELQATQEELERQSGKYKSFTNSVNQILIRAEFNTEGNLVYANEKFVQKLAFANEEQIRGKSIFSLVSEKDQKWFTKIWDDLLSGEKNFEGFMKFQTNNQQDLWLIATYSCMLDSKGKIEKILFLGIDNTEQRKQSLDFQGQINALKRSTIKAEFFPSGLFLDANRKFRDALEVPLVEVYDKEIFELIPQDELPTFKGNWADIVKGESVEGEFKMVTKNRAVKWLRGTFTGVTNMYDEISKIIFIATDITEAKLMEMQTQKQAKKLKNQEEKLRQSEANLAKNLKITREEVKHKYKEIEKIKIRNEKTLEGASDAIITINQNGVVEFFNKAAEVLWGIKRHKILGKNVKNLFPPDTRKDEFISSFIDPEQKKMVGQRKEVTVVDSEGEEKPVIFLLSEAQVENEYTYTAFIQDISVDLF